jgi:hypothetical protein
MIISVICVAILAFLQGPEIDYSKFLHTSQRHSSLACTSCHARTDNSATPRFPGHKACTDCHRGQFTTPAIPMCLICHTDTKSSNPPLKSFPASFNERFNVKFDHAQHMRGSARPQQGCNGCHAPANRGVALSIRRTSRRITVATVVTPLRVNRMPDARSLRAAFAMNRRRTGRRPSTRARIDTLSATRIMVHETGWPVLTVTG